MNPANAFSADYAQARTKFLDAAADAGAAVERMLHPEHGPADEVLSTDVAWLGPRSAERVLVLISGTHGVEGFCGSGAQIDWLRRGEGGSLPENTAVLLIHAINPHGFAWVRRVTEDNVDLNRNWFDFDTRAMPPNPEYLAVRDGICLREYTPQAVAAADAALADYAARHGRAAMVAAITTGQHIDPQGLFFAGTQATWSRRTQTAIFREYLGEAAKVAIIDYHTGLGPWGYAERIVTLPPAHAAFARARAWYGAAVTSSCDGSSSVAAIDGDGIGAAHALLSGAEITGIAFECGVKTPEETLDALRADLWLYQHGDPRSPQGDEIRMQLRDVFYADCDYWKGMVAAQSLLLCRQALAGLQSSDSIKADPAGSASNKSQWGRAAA